MQKVLVELTNVTSQLRIEIISFHFGISNGFVPPRLLNSHFPVSLSLSRNRKRVAAPPPPGGTLGLKGDGAPEEGGEGENSERSGRRKVV